MSGFARRALALALMGATPAAALAQRGGHPGGGARISAPAFRSAPAFHSAPTVRTNPGGFNFNDHDFNAHPATVPQRPSAPVHSLNPGNGTQRPVQSFAHAANTVGAYGPHQGQFHGRAIENPHHWNGSWGWNRGAIWQPAPTYWGGGFWGPWALGALTGAILFGSIIDYDDQVIYPSYQVDVDSPGAQLLQNYGLQQTECGPPNLVVIWGPDNSVICAYPNDTVAPGNYELDPA